MDAITIVWTPKYDILQKSVVTGGELESRTSTGESWFSRVAVKITGRGLVLTPTGCLGTKARMTFVDDGAVVDCWVCE